MPPRRGAGMPRIEPPSHVGVFTRNRERAAAFYTRKVGLVARRRGSGGGPLGLGAAAAGGGGGRAPGPPGSRPGRWRRGPRRTEISRMDFVTIVTRDMDRSVGFFTKALGLRVKRDLEEG